MVSVDKVVNNILIVTDEKTVPERLYNRSDWRKHFPEQWSSHCSILASVSLTFFSGFWKFPIRFLHNLKYPTNAKWFTNCVKMLFLKAPPFLSFILVNHLFNIYLASICCECSYVVMVWCRSFKFENFRKVWQLEHAGIGITEVFLWNKTWWDSICICCRIFRNDGVQSSTLWGESQRNEHCHIICGSERQMSKRWCPAQVWKHFIKG